MQGYSFTHDRTRDCVVPVGFAACLRDGARVTLAQYGRLLALAGEHAVTPLIRERVLAHEALREGAYAVLRDEALRDAALETRRNARLERSITALAAAGVPSLVFKGGALAHRLYTRPELRPRDDTDLLIRPDHLDATHAVLVDLGFARIPGVEGSLIMRQRLYRHVDDDGLVHNLDLHWAITNEARAGAFEPRALLAASEPLPALGPHARAPDDEDSLLLACLHLDAHHAGEVRLIWLYDVDRLVRTLDHARRLQVCERARLRGLEAPCAWVLPAARDALGTPLTGFEPLLETPQAPPASGRGARWLRDLSRLPGTRERLQWFAQHLFPPTEYLRQRSPVPGAPAWRLYAGRALRGVGHLFRR